MTRKDWHHLYTTEAWLRIREAQLAREPLCRMCQEAGVIAAATVCDHVEPHKGDPEKFFAGPFQSLCEPHHNSSKQREEARGFSSAVGPDGWPLDERHPANRAGQR